MRRGKSRAPPIAVSTSSRILEFQSLVSDVAVEGQDLVPSAGTFSETQRALMLDQTFAKTLRLAWEYPANRRP